MPVLESAILPRFPQKQKRGGGWFSGSLNLACAGLGLPENQPRAD
ncbi:hypothetical protein [Eikenella sp. Marseille-P7795]|nr:hypothetical protein [Eikenella sp. Marseille-P7795]